MNEKLEERAVAAMLLINPRQVESASDIDAIYYFEMTGAVGCPRHEPSSQVAESTREVERPSFELQKAV